MAQIDTVSSDEPHLSSCDEYIYIYIYVDDVKFYDVVEKDLGVVDCSVHGSTYC